MAASVEVLREGAVARVRLNRPERRNAFDEALIAELMAAFESDDVRGDATRVVVVEGAGEHFCAGADAGWMRRAAAWSEEENRADSLRMAQMFASIAACPHPVVARAHGAALGGGAGIVAACDVAIADPGALFGFTEVRLGIIPAVISPFVLRKVDPASARRYFLTGEPFDAREAMRIGLVQVVAGDEGLDAAVAAFVGAALLAGGPRAQAEVKRLLEVLPATSPDDRAALTSAWTARLRASEEGSEGLAAFLEKRKPSWHPEHPEAKR